MKNLILIIYMFIASNVYGQAGSFNDLFHIGQVGSGVDVELEIGDKGSFRYNFGTSTMQVTHDGTNYVDVASGEAVLTSNRVVITDGSGNQTSGSLVYNETSKVMIIPSAGYIQMSSYNVKDNSIESYINSNITLNARGNGQIVSQNDGVTVLKVDDEGIETKQVSVFTNPTAGHNKLYFKSDDILYSRNSAGVEVPVDSGGSDHTLGSFDLLENKTIDNSNIIQATKHANVIEVGDDSIYGAADRSATINLHAQTAVSSNARIVRSSGINGILQFNQYGTGKTYFTAGAGTVMYYSQKGSLVIGKENFTSEGGQLVLEAANSEPYSAHVDNANDEFRVHNGVTVWQHINLSTGRVDMNGAVDINAVGGNVPHTCLKRSASSTLDATLDCAANEVVMGGGCHTASNIAITKNYSPGASSWNCRLVSSSTVTVWGICCLY